MEGLGDDGILDLEEEEDLFGILIEGLEIVLARGKDEVGTRNCVLECLVRKRPRERCCLISPGLCRAQTYARASAPRSSPRDKARDHPSEALPRERPV